MNKKIALLMLAFFSLLFCNLNAQQTKRVFLIGNSVTDGVNYSGFKALAEDPSGPGNTHIWARHMIPGSPLFLLWNYRTGPSGFAEAPYGFPSTAFVDYQWDAITLQPFDRHLVDGSGASDEGDVAQCTNYVNLAKTMSPNCQFYILGRYPRAAGTTNDPANDAASTAQSWNVLHTRKYTGGWDGTNETRDYYEKLTAACTAANPTLAKPFRIIPLGEVMYSLNNKMIAGQVPGYTKIWQLYADGIHLNLIGSYLNACTFYATIYKESPVGRIVPSEYGAIAPSLALIIQQTVWEVVSTYPQAGIFGVVVVPVSSVSVSPSTISVAINQTFQLTPTVAPSNASNQNISWSSSNSAVASVSFTGVITGKSVGTANITITSSADPSKTSTCAVTVVSGSIAVTGIAVSPTSLNIKRGNSSSLTVTVAPINATNPAVTWSSSDITKATVDANGVVSALGVGTTNITATSVNDPSKTAVTAVTVLANAAPVAVITASTVSGAAPLVVNFNSANSTDADAGDYVLGFEWDFGDNTAIEKSAAPSHTFTTAGTYTVKLRVMDNNNLYGSIVTTTITVTPNLTGVDLASWNFAGKGGSTTVAAKATDANVTASVTSFGTGLGAMSYLGSGFTAGGMATTLAGAINSKDYIEFSITPAAGKLISIYSIKLRPISQNRLRYFSLLSSVNGFTANSELGKISSEVSINVPLVSVNTIGHTNLATPVTFRIYMYGTGGNNYEAVGLGNPNASLVENDLIVSGVVNTVINALDENNITNLLVYPNPAFDKLTLNLGLLVGKTDISILDLQGRSIINKTSENSMSEIFNIADLKSGMYIVKVVNNGKIMMSKFVKK